MIITFCGHSTYTYNAEDEEKVLNIIENQSKEEKVVFYLGGYGNFDIFAKNCAKKYKEKHRDAKLVFVTPYINAWLDERREYYQEEYDEILYPELENVPLRFAIAKRNEWMARNSDIVIAYVQTHFGGAYAFLRYAIKYKKKIFNIYSGNYDCK